MKLSATDIELAMKLEVLVSEKAKQLAGPRAGAGAFAICSRRTTCSPSSPTA